MLNQGDNRQPDLFRNLTSVLYLLIILGIVILFLGYQIFNKSNDLLPISFAASVPEDSDKFAVQIKYTPETNSFWVAPDPASVKSSALYPQIEYGRELIMHTAKYLGPKGSVAQISNGMNCQNCHLDAGTRIYGNNYGSVYATYPKFRARSGTSENIYKRVNDCFERSLNGLPLDSMSAEMQAIKAYLMFLGRDVEKGTSVKGAGLIKLDFLDRAADAGRGQIVYQQKCVTCHMADGQGVMAQSGHEYTYPPLWGKHSYNDGAGLYRLSNFARYVKANMPLGATYDNPQLTDEEAWDVAAYVNSRNRPHKENTDWPDISKKPVDHPFGPYVDNFSEKQHKFGPFIPILQAYK